MIGHAASVDHWLCKHGLADWISAKRLKTHAL